MNTDTEGVQTSFTVCNVYTVNRISKKGVNLFFLWVYQT